MSYQMPPIKKTLHRWTEFECARCRRFWMIEGAPWNHPGWYCPHCGYYHWSSGDAQPK